ncbi:hypothetical protein MKW98_003727 [Papaver atlanticum]|uniref:Uncharacterized protein n=1 Tax=Papaver atlanticum TaxID=357466 RepID=A0AAD4T842_9MAGN|nr:hypothetical protein MKW98_003727 [Papaver atlanticum]
MVEIEEAEHSIGIKQDSAGTSSTTQCSIVDSIQQILEDSSSTTQCYIYRVHEKLRRMNEFAYKPELVSIGPFHYGLGTIEKHKLCYVGALLSSMGKINNKSLIDTWQDCVGRVEGFQDEARKCYSEPIQLRNEKFVEILVTDGLFIIELFRRFAGLVAIPPNDPFLANHENQIPMVILKCLMDVPSIKVCVGRYPLHVLTVRFFLPLLPQNQSEDNIQAIVSSYDAKHLLDLLRKAFHNQPQSVPEPKHGRDKKIASACIPCATELKQSGVKFVKGTGSSILDIRFKDGILEIPPLVIEDNTDALLRNLIALEQQVNGVDNYISSFAYMMDGLINSREDVRILRKAGIIDNMLGADEDVAVLFNKICCGINIGKSHYFELYNELNTYYRTPWNQRIAMIKSFICCCSFSACA